MEAGEVVVQEVGLVTVGGVAVGGREGGEGGGAGSEVVAVDAQPGAYLDPKGELMFATSAPGVFAAGDVRIHAHGRVGQAVGQGVAVVASMEHYLTDTWQTVLKDEGSQAWILRKVVHDAKETAS
ncbi:hypothetical protein [Streptomyces virginiae]|uniref:hypothetical protein n=1 Tax=Streptomyces virginiae TaxID=1961 RepID=UPI002250A677|nr:hypothetical protein [Streptomyces virginiae]MCX5174410.1 hypothetical protein [Streptomyces virginiae]